jgi:cell pole-organizing protein PopZ
MNQPAKAQEPSMEEILASIRRIIADEDTGKAVKPAAAAPAPPPPPPKPVPAPPPVAAKPAPPPPPAPPPRPTNNQADVDAMLASMDAAPKPAPKPPEVAPPPPPPAPPAADVLDLTEAMATPSPAAQSFRRIDAASDVVFAEGSAEPAEPSPASAIDRGLLSNATRSAVDSAFHSLANTVLGNNARTLEDLVKEMLRPMLKSWLDDNLPGLVERIVRAEIERVSRGGR